MHSVCERTLLRLAAFFFIKEAGKQLNDNGKLITSLLGAFTSFHAAYAGGKAPIEHFTRAAAKNSARGISVTAVGPGRKPSPITDRPPHSLPSA